MSKKKTNFEADIARLAEIVEHVESSETSLDMAISLYKEGLKLAAKCNKALGKYEEEILALQKDTGGNFETDEFVEENYQS